VEAKRIADFTAWPSHDNNERNHFGNSYDGIITTHFKNIRENSDVKIHDVLTDWNMIKSNF